MNLPKFAIENHQFSTIVIIILVLMGVVSFITMPRSEDPQISPAGTTIFVVYPGANPKDVEELVTKPIEDVLNELENIKEIKSNSRSGFGIISIEFLAGSDGDEKYSDVVQKVNTIRNKLPDEIYSVDMLKWTINDVKILQLALVSDEAEYKDLEQEGERLKDLLKKVQGVKTVEAWAYPDQEIKVTVDMERMANMNIPLSHILGAIQMSNANIPGGKMNIGNKEFSIQTSGSYDNLDELRNTIVNLGSEQVVYLKDIADIKYSYEELKYIARYNNRRAIYVTVTQKNGTNIFTIMNDLKSKIGQFKKSLPKSITVATVFDQSKSVDSRLNGFFINLLQGLLLVGLIVILAVGFRASLIVMVVIPISILIGIGFLDLSNYGLQQMSIAGLVIALGLLVDNAIVVTENIARFMKLGYSKTEAAIKGTSQIAWAVTSSTVTTVLAFVPMMLMQDITGDFIRSMPLTVVFTLVASLWVSITLTPYLSKNFFTTASINHESRMRKWMNKLIQNNYRKRLNYAIEHPKIIISSSLLVFFFSLGLFPFIGISFFPKAEKPQFMIDINLPEGSNINKTNDVTEYVESVLSKKEEIVSFASNVGHGNPRIYYNVLSKRNAANHAQLLVEVGKYEYYSFNNILNNLREEFSKYPGAKIDVKDFIQGPPIEAPIAIKVIGDNLKTLKNISTDIENFFHETDGTVNIYNPLATTKADIQVKINRAKAAMLGVPLVDIDKAIRASITGLIVSKYRDENGKEYNIIVKGKDENESEIKKFDKIFVTSIKGVAIPLKQLATIEFKSTPLSISHYDLNRTVTITADVKAGYSVNSVTNKIIEKIEKYSFPKSYSYYVAGELESQQKSFGGMAKALIIAIVGIFGVLVLQFRSYTQPLIVFSAIPLAIIGSIIALLITGNSFSFTAFVGLTSLVGIVVNNSIILVDYSNQLRTEGKSIIEAVKTAGEVRFIPIILTTATTIGGLLPLTLGGGTMWAPMGWAIIGGLIASTFLTLIVVPVLYKVYTK
jgi:multidrug efflux pump subunit AcrB